MSQGKTVEKLNSGMKERLNLNEQQLAEVGPTTEEEREMQSVII